MGRLLNLLVGRRKRDSVGFNEEQQRSLVTLPPGALILTPNPAIITPNPPVYAQRQPKFTPRVSTEPIVQIEVVPEAEPAAVLREQEEAKKREQWSHDRGQYISPPQYNTEKDHITHGRDKDTLGREFRELLHDLYVLNLNLSTEGPVYPALRKQVQDRRWRAGQMHERLKKICEDWLNGEHNWKPADLKMIQEINDRVQGIKLCTPEYMQNID